MKWAVAVVAVVAVLAVFAGGFGVFWYFHRPTAPPVDSPHVAESGAPPAALAAGWSPSSRPPAVAQSSSPPASETEDASPFPWPRTQAPLRGVLTVDATHYVVDSAFVKDATTDPGKVAALRVTPEVQDGAVAGVRVFGVLPTSVAGKLGIQNGDLLESVNGLSLNTPKSALDAFAAAKSAKRVEVSLRRRGAPLTLHYLVTTAAASR